MASQPPPPKGGGMMSLYANLLDPSENTSAPGTISRAPVIFNQATEDESQQGDAASKKQQISAASLRFQPTKRPQLQSQKPKAKPTVPKAPPVSAANNAPTSTTASTTPARAPPKTTLADWAGTADDDDVNGFYGGEKRQRGGRKKRKKNREAETHVQNWDDIYDPSRPNSYEEYKHSDEKIREVREWKDRLYAHRMTRGMSSDSEEEYARSRINNRFAPPPSFAPPPNINEPPAASLSNSLLPGAAPEPPVDVSMDDTGDDAFARRLRMSQVAGQAPDISAPRLQPPPPPPDPAPPMPPSQPDKVYEAATISRAPVRYTLPPPPDDIPATEEELEATFANEEGEEQPQNEDEPRSLRPGQKGFAERLLTKYGWTKGSGLGASGTGIAKPLQVKVDKRKKKPDSEGGGFVGPTTTAKIIGGKRKQSDEGKFGPMSEVIVMHGMLDGMDVDAELASEDGGLMQEIGEECGEKYGRVERVYIDRSSEGRVPVFVKFTSQLSALRAVNALEGRIFNGNAITARFFNNEKFERGIFQE